MIYYCKCFAKKCTAQMVLNHVCSKQLVQSNQIEYSGCDQLSLMQGQVNRLWNSFGRGQAFVYLL